MPFADYEDMADCKRAHSDKDDPGAYCAEIHKQVKGHYPSQKSAEDLYDDPEVFVKTALEAMERIGAEPTEDRLADVRRTERKLIE